MICKKTIAKVCILSMITVFCIASSNSFAQRDFENYVIEPYSTKEYFNDNKVDLDNKSLENTRDDLIREAYSIMNERMGETVETYDEFYKNYTSSMYSPHKFFMKKFKDKSYNDILKKEIVFLQHLNSTYETIDMSAGYMPCAFSTYENFLFKKNHGEEMVSTKDMDGEDYKKMFDFYVDNFEYMPYEMDSDVEQIFYTIYPEGIEQLGTKAENEIQNKLKGKALKVKEYLKSLKIQLSDRDKRLIELCDKIEDAPISSDSEGIEKDEYIPINMERASIRSKVLSYAREHGYSNSYSGDGPPHPYIDYSDYGGDCANFVSQCLHNGNINFWTSSPPNSERSWFFYSKGNRSDSWINAQMFRKHW